MMNDEDSIEVTIDDILAAVRKSQPEADIALIQSAYELAHAAHEGQKRASGEDYIIHPLNVAKILTDLHLDEATISAALLHDVVEDTTYTIEEIEANLLANPNGRFALALLDLRERELGFYQRWIELDADRATSLTKISELNGHVVALQASGIAKDERLAELPLKIWHRVSQALANHI